jgi:hypothetical protein
MADRAEQILKTFLSFNPESDLNDNESKEKLASLFREFLMSSDNTVVEVLPKFIQSLKDVISSLGFGEEPAPEVNASETPKEDQESTEEDTGDDSDAEETVEDKVAAEGFKRKKQNMLIERANDFIW